MNEYSVMLAYTLNLAGNDGKEIHSSFMTLFILLMWDLLSNLCMTGTKDYNNEYNKPKPCPRESHILIGFGADASYSGTREAEAWAVKQDAIYNKQNHHQQ